MPGVALPIESVPLFAGLSPRVLDRVRGVVELKHHPAGAAILRRGETGRSFHVVADGTIAVVVGDFSRSTREIVLDRGEAFGEMSILSGAPISATVVARRDSVTYRMSAEDFMRLAAEEIEFLRAILQTTVSRLRDRTDPDRRAKGTTLVVLAAAKTTPLVESLARAIADAIQVYAPVSVVSAWNPATPRPPGALLRPPRDIGRPDDYVVAVADVSTVDCIVPFVTRDDIVIGVVDGSSSPPRITGTEHVAECTLDGAEWAGRFAYRMRSVQRGSGKGFPEIGFEPADTLQRLVRWIVGREVSIALGAGAARGLAHLGVLEVLEEANVPVDFLCGSSMGGIVALLYAIGGSSREAIRIARETMSSTGKIRDLSWFPRASLFRGRKLSRAAERFASLRFSDLHRPAAVVSADLVAGEPVVLDSGSVRDALLATCAIPGIFPPVRIDGRLLVDGALVSRLPAQLMNRRRSGVRLAVHVVPSPSDRPGQDADVIASRTGRLFGFGDVIARSWDLLAWWHGAAEVESVDVLLQPTTGSYSGSRFDRFEDFIEAGRAIARCRLPEIRALMSRRVGPTEADRV